MKISGVYFSILFLFYALNKNAGDFLRLTGRTKEL
jgi:hypothetical protein